MIRFRKLKKLLFKELNKTLVIRKNFDCLYFVVHFNRFFRLTIIYVIITFNQFFDFIFASRQNNKIQANLEQHLLRFLQFDLKNNVV